VWIVRWTLIGVVMLAILAFALQNTEMVKLAIWTWHSDEMPLYLVAYFAFAAGIIVAALIATVNQIQHRMVLSRARRDIRRLKEELTQLRRVTLDDALLEDDATEQGNDLLHNGC
jgi:uncharacterized integral membrane protein